MGVMNCDRGDCRNVCCDRISHKRNEYICNPCFEELVRLGPSTDLDEFMKSPVASADDPEASRAYFEKIFHETSHW